MALRVLLVVLLAFGLSACSSTRDSGKGSGTPGEYKIGKPYQINGVWYYPKEDYRHSETGIASWYGADFHGKRTANGETFDQNELTAAHRTLPMPSLVRVTNLDNGRSVVVRVNDRGPFAHGRVIDLSRRAAQLLGFESAGTAKVRVEVMEIESKAIADAAKRRGSTGYPTQTASATSRAPVAEPQQSNVQPTTPEPEDVEARIAAAYDDSSNQMEAPQTASREAVEAVPLEPAPNAAAVQEDELPPIAPAPVQAAKPQPKLVAPTFKKTAIAPVSDPTLKIPGHKVNGRFYPDAKVEQRPVNKKASIYVQAGAFSVKDNAVKLKDKLNAIAPASVSTAQVNGANFYRVRLGPISSVQEADRILTKVLGTDKKARITVE